MGRGGFLNLSVWLLLICTKTPQRVAGAPLMPKIHIYRRVISLYFLSSDPTLRPDSITIFRNLF